VELVTIIWRNVKEDKLCNKIHPRRRLKVKVISQSKGKRGMPRRDHGSNMGTRQICSYCGKSGHQIEKCCTLYPHLYWKQNQKYVKALARRQATTLDEVNSLAERSEK
jgi:hypothetical protein